MELRQLEYFLMVCEVNSFTRAAERLYVSQPAVTSAIKSLEDELGIQLFDRTLKQAVLTSEGQVFYKHIQHVMHGVSQTLSEIDNLKKPQYRHHCARYYAFGRDCPVTATAGSICRDISRYSDKTDRRG